MVLGLSDAVGVIRRSTSWPSTGWAGALISTPRGIIAAESSFSPTRARLNHRQAGFAQRLHARPANSQGPEEILTREGSELTSCIRAAAGIGRGGTAETLAIYQALQALD